MTWRAFLRIAGVLLLVDGVLAALFGKAYLRPWRALPGSLGQGVSFFSSLPGFVIRLLGLWELVMGLRILGAVPLDVRRVYRLASGWYDPFRELFRLSLLSPAERAVDLALKQYLPPGGKVLDLGCGTGANLARILRLGLPFGSYTGVDLSRDMLAVALRQFGDTPNARFVQVDLMREPIPNGQYDLVISTWLLSHIADPRHVIEKAMAKAKLGSYTILLFFSRSDSWLDPIVDLLFAPFSARPVPRDTYLTFPCQVSSRQYCGGLVTLMVLANVKMSDLVE